MYALFPAFVSSPLLFYGVYVVTTYGCTRASLAFLSMTTLTCLWQGIWAFLFRTQDVGTAQVPAKLGWITILIMPIMLYHFAVGATETPNERHWLLVACALDAVPIGLLLTTDLITDGAHQFHFGFYPRASVLGAVYVAQAAVLVSRGVWVLYHEQRHATAEKRKRLPAPLFDVGLILLAAADYVVSYDVAFYPPGVFPLAVALGVTTVGVAKFDLMRPYALTTIVAHEVRTPLTTIRLQAAETAHAWPDVYRDYLLAIDSGLCQPPQHLAMLGRLSKLAEAITSEVVSAHSVVEVALASVTLERPDRRTFAVHSLRGCMETAVARYPFQAGERGRVHVQTFNADWRFIGSDTLLVCVLFNLLKNALHAIQIARKGHIEISARQDGDSYALVVRGSATGIPPNVQRRIFDPFLSTKHVGKGSSVGLTSYRRVIQAFRRRIRCKSVVGEYTLFSMRFSQPPAT